MMDCFRCKGTATSKLKPHVVTIDKYVIVVKNVPSFVCGQCGEAYFSDEVMQNLEQLLDKFEALITEVAIVDYAENVA